MKNEKLSNIIKSLTKEESFQYRCFHPECNNRTAADKTLCGLHERKLEKMRNKNSKGAPITDYKLKKLTKDKNRNYYNPKYAPNEQAWFHEVYKSFSHKMDLVNPYFRGTEVPLLNTKFKYIIIFNESILSNLKDLKYTVIHITLGDYESLKLGLNKIMKKRKVSISNVTLYKDNVEFFSYGFILPEKQKKTVKEKEKIVPKKTVILRKG